MRKIIGHKMVRGDLVITLGGKRQNAHRTVTISKDTLEDREPVGHRTQLVTAVVDALRAAQDAP